VESDFFGWYVGPTRYSVAANITSNSSNPQQVRGVISIATVLIARCLRCGFQLVPGGGSDTMEERKQAHTTKISPFHCSGGILVQYVVFAAKPESDNRKTVLL
jgi:hypothetical protein